MLTAIARKIEIDSDVPTVFDKIEKVTRAFTAPGEWSKRWWEIPFEAVIRALRESYRKFVDARHLEAIPEAISSDDLRAALEERGTEIDPDPYESARVNGDRFERVLSEAYDMYRVWFGVHHPDSEVPDLPPAPNLGPDAYLVRWSDADLWQRALATLGDRRFTTACDGCSDPQMLRDWLGLEEEVVEESRGKRAERKEEAARKRRSVKIAGKSFKIGTIDYAMLLRQHTRTLEPPVGPRASEDEFTPLGSVAGHRGSGGGGTKGRSGHLRLSAEESEMVGILGEMQAYRFLKEEFGGRSVRASAWVSELRLKALPVVEGEKDEISYGLGFDFRFNHGGIRWHVEMKATKGEEPTFDLRISEVDAATRIARRRGKTWRWRILRVRNALSKKPEVDWLPNPFEEGFKTYYRLHRGGMVVSYAPEQD